MTEPPPSTPTPPPAQSSAHIDLSRHSVIFFDGVCTLCNASVLFIIARDPHAHFKFAALQSDAAAALHNALPTGLSLPDSIVLIDRGGLFTRSTAALRIARRLRFPWPILCVFILVPRPIRNWAYQLIAKNRYRWFGQRDACLIPTPELRARFL